MNREEKYEMIKLLDSLEFELKRLYIKKSVRIDDIYSTEAAVITLLQAIDSYGSTL